MDFSFSSDSPDHQVSPSTDDNESSFTSPSTDNESSLANTTKFLPLVTFCPIMMGPARGRIRTSSHTSSECRESRSPWVLRDAGSLDPSDLDFSDVKEHEYYIEDTEEGRFLVWIHPDNCGNQYKNRYNISTVASFPEHYMLHSLLDLARM